jgi:nicotinamidase-related amidase
VEAGADTLVVTGCTTSGCVRSSVADAFSYNFKVSVPSDAVYDRSPVVHEANLFDMAQKYADVATTAEILERLSALPGAAAR